MRDSIQSNARVPPSKGEVTEALETAATVVGGAGSENVIQIYGKKSWHMCDDSDATYSYLYRRGESEKIPI